MDELSSRRRCLAAGSCGRVIRPYTFEEEGGSAGTVREELLVLSRDTPTRINPGDYAFMVANPDAD